MKAYSFIQGIISSIWVRHLKISSENLSICKKLLYISGENPVEEVNISEVTDLTKITKHSIVLLVFHKDCLCRHSVLCIHSPATFRVFKFQKLSLGVFLQHSWLLNKQRLLKNACVHLLRKLQGVGKEQVYWRTIL